MVHIIRIFRSGGRNCGGSVSRAVIMGGRFHFRAATAVGILAAAQDGRPHDIDPRPKR